MKRNKELLYDSLPVLQRFKKDLTEELYFQSQFGLTKEEQVDKIISETFNY